MYRVLRMNASLVLLSATLPSCKGTTSPSSPSNPPGGITYLNWVGSDNGTSVLDANGNRYRFQASDGCMFSVTLSTGPVGFCLTSSSTSSTGFAPYGPTNCSNPTTNTLCNSASFDVVLTIDPVKPSGCIAVLGNGTAASVTEVSLAVTSVSGGYSITTTASPSAFTAYWNGVIPGCGSSSYAGAYAGTAPAYPPPWTTSGSGCIIVTTPPPTGALAFSIDGGGIINSDAAKISGATTATGSGQFTQPTLYPPGDATCTPTYTITSATRNSSGKWVLSGAWVFGGYSSSFIATQS